MNLAVGLASWRIGGLACTAPVLLRPLGIRRHHSDFELKLHGSFTVNPELVRALRTHFGIDLDGQALAALAYDGGVFKPQPVIDHLRALAASIDSFTVHPRLVVSTFADVGAAMARDAVDLDHPVLNALAGHPGDRETLDAPPRGADRRRAPTSAPRRRTPCCWTRMPSRRRVLARITAGQSLAVHTLPGTGGTQTVINAVGSLVRDGKRVLVVSARRSTLDGVRHRLTGIGLPGLAVSPRDLQRDLIRAIGRNEKAEQPKVGDIDDALVRLRGVLRDYRSAVTARHPDARRLGARRAAPARRPREPQPRRPRPPPASTSRVLTTLAPARGEGGRGARRGRPARRVPLRTRRLALVRRVVRDDERRAFGARARRPPAPPGRAEPARARLRAHRADAHAPVPHDRASWARTCELLQGIRDSLDRFSPTVFERPLGELIQAHGPRRDAPSLSGTQRRRLRDCRASTCAPACTSPTCTRRSCACSSSAPSGSATSTPA